MFVCAHACAPSAPPPRLLSEPPEPARPEAAVSARYLGAFGSEGALPGQFSKPGGLALLDGAGVLYAADTGNHRVQTFRLDGRFQRAYGGFGSRVGQMDQPVDVAARRQARTLLYIAERGNARVQVCDERRERYRVLIQDDGSAAFEPSGVAVDRAGRVYIANAAAGALMRLSPQGAEQWTRGPPDLRLRSPLQPRIGPDGGVAAPDPVLRVVARVDFAGNRLESWAHSELGRPSAAAADARGRWYVCDTQNRRVAALDSRGRPIAFIGETVLTEPSGAAVTRGGLLFVADRGAHDIKRFQLIEGAEPGAESVEEREHSGERGAHERP